MDIVSWLSKQANKLADNLANDHSFYVKASPEGKIDTSSIFFLTAYTDRDEIGIVPCSYRWLRIKNGVVEERRDFKGNSYICGLQDVGATLQVEVTSNDASHPGKVVLSYGPVAIEAVLRQSIKKAMARGNSKYNCVMHIAGQELECCVIISKKEIAVIHEQSGIKFQFEYAMGDPMVTFSIQTPQAKFSFNPCKQEEFHQFAKRLLKERQKIKHIPSQLKIQFGTKHMRDQFQLIMKVFNAQKQLGNSIMLSILQRKQVQIDILAEMQSLRSDMLKIYEAYNKERMEKFAYYTQNIQLQQEIEEIINAYSKIFEEKTSHYNKSSHRRRESIISVMERFKILEAENNGLKHQLQLQYQTNNSKLEGQNHQNLSISRTVQMEQQNIVLKKRIMELQKIQQASHKRLELDESDNALQKYLENHSDKSQISSLNPENQSMRQLQEMKQQISSLEIEKNELKIQYHDVRAQLKKERDEHRLIKKRLQQRISELNEEIMSTKRSTEAINRSYSLSAQLQDYNYEQNMVLREQNDFLLSEAEKLSKLCDKYKSECKRLKYSSKI